MAERQQVVHWLRQYLPLILAAGLVLTVTQLTVSDQIILDRTDADGNVTLTERPDEGGFALCVADGAYTGGLVVTADNEVTNVWAETCDGTATNLQIIAKDGEQLFLIGDGETTIVGGHEEDTASVVEINEDGVTLTTAEQDLRLLDTILSWSRDGSSWAMAPTLTPRRLRIEPLAAAPNNHFLDIAAPTRALAVGLAGAVPATWTRFIDTSPSAGGVAEPLTSFEMDLADHPWNASGRIELTVVGTTITPGSGENKDVTLMWHNTVTTDAEQIVSCDFAGANGPWTVHATIVFAATNQLFVHASCEYFQNDGNFNVQRPTTAFTIELDDVTAIELLAANTNASDLTVSAMWATLAALTASGENPAIEDGEIGP